MTVLLNPGIFDRESLRRSCFKELLYTLVPDPEGHFLIVGRDSCAIGSL
jgi:hypothetical protein